MRFMGTVALLAAISGFLYYKAAPSPTTALATSALAPNDTPTDEQAAPSVVDSATICRQLAPDDPYVDDDEEGARAYDACAEAVAQTPDDAELVYLEAVSALQAGAPSDLVVALLHDAQERGQCGAGYWLGEQAWYGDHDADAAEQFYRQASDCGDVRGQRALFQRETFADSEYVDYLEAAYNHDVAYLNRDRFIPASWAIGFVLATNESYNGAKFEPCWAAKNFHGSNTLYKLEAAEAFDAYSLPESWFYEQIAPIALGLLLPEMGPTRSLAAVRSTAREAGKNSLITLTTVTSCGSYLTSRIFEGLRLFADAKRSLFEVLRDRRSDVRTMADFRRLVLHRAPRASGSVNPER